MKKMLKELLKDVIHLLIRVFLSICKRNKSWVVCIGWNGKRFADNSRYMYLYLNEHKEKLNLKKVVWLTSDRELYMELRNKGYDVCRKFSLKGIYCHLHAKYLFYDQLADEYYKFLTYGGTMINLWHGMPIKKFGLWSGDVWNLRHSYLLTCSSFGDKMIGGAFNLDSNRYIHGMYPRNYYLLHDIPFITQKESFYLNLLQSKLDSKKKIIFYLPTFRKKALKFLGEENEERLTKFYLFLQQKNYFLLTKVHFYGAMKNHDTFSSLNDSILNLPPEVDIYPFLKKTNILLTDYLSVLFDFLYLNRDIVSYVYDIDVYKTKDRGFLYDYASLPVTFVYSLNDLESYLLLKKTKIELAHEAENRQKWLEKCFDKNTMEETVKVMLTL